MVNPSAGFAQVTEIAFDGPVTASLALSHFLFVAYEAPAADFSVVPVGHIKGFVLTTQPPTEFVLTAPGLPCAHVNTITSLTACQVDEANPLHTVLFSGSRDCTYPPARGATRDSVVLHCVGATTLVARRAGMHPLPLLPTPCRLR